MVKKYAVHLSRPIGYFVAVASLAAILAGTARAQKTSGWASQSEVSGAFSFVRANSTGGAGGFNLNGGSASWSYNFSSSFSVVADVGAYRFSGLPSTLHSTMYTYLFGPRITVSKFSRMTPFAQILVGGGRLNANSNGFEAAENEFAMAVGGGLDVPLHHHFALRAVQAEYLLTRFDSVAGASARQNNIRISTGVVIRFGGR